MNEHSILYPLQDDCILSPSLVSYMPVIFYGQISSFIVTPIAPNPQPSPKCVSGERLICSNPQRDGNYIPRDILYNLSLNYVQ